MAKIQLSAALLKFTNQKNNFEIRETNLKSSLEELFKQYPELKDKILDSKYEVKKYASIFVDGESINELNGLQTQLTSKSKVNILIALAGG